MCGEVHDVTLGLSFEGDCSREPLYTVTRASQSNITITPPYTLRGDAVNRFCRDHGLLVLNGRSRSDRFGAFTHRTCRGDSDTRTVLDLAVVPREACADMRVVTVREGG